MARVWALISMVCDVEVIQPTLTNCAIHRCSGRWQGYTSRLVRGQFQGAAAQGIGWALNEEYIYGDDGRLQNPVFDYRIPVCSDMPFIDTKILEVPNPNHPTGFAE